jgi:hypothetical protein
MTSCEDSIRIRRVTETVDRESVFCFRYSIYCEEMHRPQPHADHVRRMISEPLDQTALIYAAFRGNQVLGTIRSNYLRNTESTMYRDLYRVPECELPDSSITTKLMVSPTARRTALAAALAVASYTDGLQAGIRADYIDCNEHLVAMFEKLGYVRLRLAHHPDYGPVQVMRLDLTGIDHLDRKRSPFARAYRSVMTGATSNRRTTWT